VGSLGFRTMATTLMSSISSVFPLLLPVSWMVSLFTTQGLRAKSKWTFKSHFFLCGVKRTRLSSSSSSKILPTGTFSVFSVPSSSFFFSGGPSLMALTVSPISR
jgi:hypothetical protein